MLHRRGAGWFTLLLLTGTLRYRRRPLSVRPTRARAPFLSVQNDTADPAPLLKGLRQPPQTLWGPSYVVHGRQDICTSSKTSLELGNVDARLLTQLLTIPTWDAGWLESLLTRAPFMQPIKPNVTAVDARDLGDLFAKPKSRSATLHVSRTTTKSSAPI